MDCESNLPTGNESVDYPLATVYSSGENVNVSNIRFEIQNETVIPKARYHVSIDGADKETASQLGIGAYWEYDSEFLHESAYTFAVSGPYVGLEGWRERKLRFEIKKTDGGFKAVNISFACRKQIETRDDTFTST